MTATLPAVTLDSKVAVSDDVLVQEIGGEAVLLDLASERYFGLDPVGTRIWALLGEGHALDRILVMLADEFDAERGRIEVDLLALVRQLAEAGLVKVD